jgi:predicted phage tail protein
MNQTTHRKGLYLFSMIVRSWILVVLSTLVAYGVSILLVQYGASIALGLIAGLLAGLATLYGLPQLMLHARHYDPVDLP